MTSEDLFLGFGSGRPPVAASLSGILQIPAAPETDPSEPPAAPGPPVAGIDSARAWLIVLAAFICTSTAFFVTYSFTTFLKAMSEEFGTGNASTSLLFSLTIFFLFVLGLPAGKASDRWGPRPVILAGSTVLGSGLLLTSIVPRIEYGYVTYGLGIGFGVACCYVPVVSQVAGWFERYRAAGLGLAVSGIGAGTILGPPVSQALIEEVGWRTTYQLLAAIATSGLLIAAALIKPAPAVSTGDPIKMGDLAANPIFRSMYLSLLLMSLALFVPFVYLKPYAELHGVSPGAAATLVSVLGFGSLGGRLILGTFAAKMGLMRLYQLCFLILAGSFLIWWLATPTFAMLATFAFVLGTAYGGYVALSPAATAELFGLAGLGAVLGALYTAGGIGGLIGPPAAGWIRDTTDAYTYSIVGSMIAGVLGFLLLRRAIRLAG
ncbi:MAG: MFS transporter [Actinomycetota bacterium]|nr:MFS transporter [Actinomycetota bacterium]